jgi:hypothetical protein
MKLIAKPEGCYTGIHATTWKSEFSVVKSKNNITNIYIGNGDIFDIWIQDCLDINNEKDIWNVIFTLDLVIPCVNELCRRQYNSGKEDGKNELQNKLKDLLDIY